MQKPSTVAFLFLSLLLFNSIAMASADGATLYAEHCSVCHGETGAGGIGVPLSLPSFQAAIDDDYIRQTILHGRPGRVMPSYAYLGKDKVEALVRYVRSWNKAKPLTFSKAPINGDASRGAKLYAQECAACHGPHGEGGKGTGVTMSRPRDLPLMPPALNNSGFLAAATDSMIELTLMQGHDGTPMVSFLKKGLSRQDIDDIVSYVRSFEKTPLPSEPKLEPGQVSPIIVYDSPYDLKTTLANVKRAIGDNEYGWGRVQTLEYGLTSPKDENQHQVIIYFCKLPFLNKALAIDPRVGMFLPCRITIVEENGKVKLMSVNPKVLSRLFNNSELNELCDQLTQDYKDIMDEATL